MDLCSGSDQRLISRIVLVIASWRHETRYRHESVKGVTIKTHFFPIFLTLRKYIYPKIPSISKNYAGLRLVWGSGIVP
jgi:hypothetical protein